MIQEEGLRDWFGKSKSKDGKKGWVNVVTGDSCASDKPGEGIPKCVSSSKRASMSKKERVAAQAAKRREDPGQQSKSGASKPTNVKTDRKVRKEEMEVNEAKDKKGKGSGTKDACYHKVKSRYSVWPSAYASGALVKCRKVGAANWGNSTKEEVELQGTEELQQFMEKCWKGYEKKGMKTMFGKRYPNCVKKEEVEISEAPAKVPLKDTGNPIQNAWNKFVPPPESSNNPNVRSGARKPGSLEAPLLKKANDTAAAINAPIKATSQATKGLRKAGEAIGGAAKAVGDYAMKNPGKAAAIGAGVVGAGLLAKKVLDGNKKKEVKEARSYSDFMNECWKTHKKVGMKMKGGKLVPDCRPKTASDYKEEVEVQSEGAAWTKKSGKSESGGLNEKGRKSYERENPGSDLKAPSKKVGNPRRASFCARMKGMKKKLTSKKTANDPDSRINKSLRAWNC
jgi:hypothetical protein